MAFKLRAFNQSVIKSDEGFTVQFLSRDILRYSDKELVVCVGFDAGGGFVSLMCKTIMQLSPHPGQRLSPTQEKRVFDNILNALNWRGLTVDFIT